jgi:glycerophosphoryl diester phosphodiesterase
MKIFLIVSLSTVAFLLLSFCVYLFLIKTERRGGMESLLSRRYAHRGLHNATRAENSISAFKAAVDAGYGIELDVRLSKDGELVVFHDDTLERVTNREGRVDAFTASELGEIKLCDTGDGIPTFRDVLALVDGKVPLLVELKEDAGKYGVTEKACEMLRDYKGEYMIESFNPLALGRVRKLMPEACRGILSQSFLKEKKYRTPTHFLLSVLVLNVVCRPHFVAFNIEHSGNAALKLTRRVFGAPTLAWTVRSEAQEKKASAEGFETTIFEAHEPEVYTK